MFLDGLICVRCNNCGVVVCMKSAKLKYSNINFLDYNLLGLTA